MERCMTYYVRLLYRFRKQQAKQQTIFHFYCAVNFVIIIPAIWTENEINNHSFSQVPTLGRVDLSFSLLMLTNSSLLILMSFFSLCTSFLQSRSKRVGQAKLLELKVST